MDLLAWTAAAYILFMPASYHLEMQGVKRIEAPGPGGAWSVIETTCVWKNDEGKSVTFQWWKPLPPYPGQPLVAVRRMSGLWAGTPASFVEAQIASGSKQHEVIAFQQLPRLDGYARISTMGLELETLQSLLKAARIRDLTPDQAANAGCGAMQSPEGMSRGVAMLIKHL